MQKERIIAGIEKVFEGYAKDKELREAIEKYCRSFQLSPTVQGHTYLLKDDGKVYVTYNLREEIVRGYDSSSREAAEAYFDYLNFRCKPPVTLTKAKAMLEEDLGKRVEELKKNYVKCFDKACNRIDERDDSLYAPGVTTLLLTGIKLDNDWRYQRNATRKNN